MKKSILNLGKALNKAEQKEINGGREFSGTCSNLVEPVLNGVVILIYKKSIGNLFIVIVTQHLVVLEIVEVTMGGMMDQCKIITQNIIFLIHRHKP